MIQKKLQDGLTDREQAQLNAWIGASPYNRKVFDQLNNETWVRKELEKFGQYNERGRKAVILELFSRSKSEVKATVAKAKVRKLMPLWMRWTAAAAVLGLIVWGLWFFTARNEATKQAPSIAITTQDVEAPKVARAMITLADGRTVALDSVTSGMLAVQGNMKLVKLADGQIAYQTTSVENIKELQFNTLSNPGGSRVVDVVLSDGSHVWLNSGSSITYPVAFVGNERKVEISGEAYFEVRGLPAIKKVGQKSEEGNQKIPFLVEANGVVTEVLGTHFNVNAYADEASIKITLLEGSVRVSSGYQLQTIKPGQQAVAANSDPSTGSGLRLRVASDIDLDAVMAWKNGWFEFDNMGLVAIMKQVSRWYDLDIIYKGQPGQQKFGGRISKDLPLSNVLKMLEEYGVKFQLNGKRLQVASSNSPEGGE